MEISRQQIEFLRQHWDLEGEIKFHRRLANFVYFTSISGKEVVLRLTDPGHRRCDEIESELHWMSYLAKNGMRVANPIPTKSHSLMTEISGEKNYFAALFEKAAGAFLTDEQAVADDMIKRWGRYIGKMHSLTKNYNPPASIRPRQQWEQDESLAMAFRSHDKDDRIPYERLIEFMGWMRSLPRDQDSYGLIHTDLHRGNFFVEEGEITAFDFDDSCYQWFSYDFVAPLNSIHKNFYEGNRHPDKDRTLEQFISGYSIENKLDSIWIERIKLFDKFRAVLTYHWIKTFTKEGVFDAKGLEWAKQKAPKLMEVLKEPLDLF